MNKVFLLGHLGKDPELRYTPGGTEVCTFSIATTEKWTDKDGTKRDETEWHRIVAWRGLAKICGEYLQKGDQISIEGKLKTRNWEDNGQKKYTTEIIAEKMEFCKISGKSGSGQTAGRPEPKDEDIPF